ncbi:hypothetical protein ACEZDB_26845 [Streptacidiphilus sp. N1-3]|uniref:Uncharacterized protein n=1 Tax=Streptacidiphilus alkalitolerans TaxID=3342712 RepID=A0ABV6X7I8_9ACTN
MKELKTTSTQSATDSHVDMDVMLGRVRGQRAARRRVYAARLDVAQFAAQQLREAHPEWPISVAPVWGGEIALPVPAWNTADLAQGQPAHPDDVQYLGDVRRIVLTGEDGISETWAEMQVCAAPLSDDRTTPWLAFATGNGEISMDLDLPGVDQLITEYQAGLAQLLAARAALVEATR